MAWHIYQSRNRESRRSPRWTWLRNSISNLSEIRVIKFTGNRTWWEFKGVLGSNIAGYLQLASRNPHLNVIYFFRPIMDPSSLSFSNMITVFLAMSLPILNPYLAEFSYPKNPENM